MKVREILKRLTADGRVEVRTKGSHHQFTHPTKLGTITVAYSSRNTDVPVGTAKAILKAAGLED